MMVTVFHPLVLNQFPKRKYCFKNVLGPKFQILLLTSPSSRRSRLRSRGQRKKSSIKFQDFVLNPIFERKKTYLTHSLFHNSSRQILRPARRAKFMSAFQARHNLKNHKCKTKKINLKNTHRSRTSCQTDRTRFILRRAGRTSRTFGNRNLWLHNVGFFEQFLLIIVVVPVKIDNRNFDKANK